MTNRVKITFEMRIVDYDDILEAMRYIMNNWSQTVRVEKLE